MSKSIEDLIVDLTAAVIENTATLRSAMSGKALAAASETVRGSTKADAEKPAEKAAPATRGRKTAAKTPTAAAVKKAAEDFLEAAGSDEDEYAERRAYIKELSAKYKGKLSEVDEDQRQAVLEDIAAYSADNGKEAEGGNDDNDI